MRHECYCSHECYTKRHRTLSKSRDLKFGVRYQCLVHCSGAPLEFLDQFEFMVKKRVRAVHLERSNGVPAGFNDMLHWQTFNAAFYKLFQHKFKNGPIGEPQDTDVIDWFNSYSTGQGMNIRDCIYPMLRDEAFAGKLKDAFVPMKRPRIVVG